MSDARGNRLTPKRSHRLYYHLNSLRSGIERVIARHFVAKQFGLLVDYGCGNMPYRSLFLPYVGKYIGCDMPGNPEADSELSEEGKVPFEDGAVDAVLSTQVLEHVEDFRGYLAESHRLLCPNGLLILSTHGVWKYHPDPTDYWRWTSSGLKLIISDAGFEIIDFRGIMGPAAIGLQIWQDAVVVRIPKFSRRIFVWLMQIFIQLADRRSTKSVRNRDASVFMVVARKKD